MDSAHVPNAYIRSPSVNICKKVDLGVFLGMYPSHVYGSGLSQKCLFLSAMAGRGNLSPLHESSGAARPTEWSGPDEVCSDIDDHHGPGSGSESLESFKDFAKWEEDNKRKTRASGGDDVEGSGGES